MKKISVKSPSYVDPRPCIIYAIRNKITNDKYVGSTVYLINQRFAAHLYFLKRGKHSSIKLQQSWNEYGSENFEIIFLEVVGVCSNIERARREKHWISIEGCYNSIKVVGPNRTFAHSEETKIKTGAIVKQKLAIPENRKRQLDGLKRAYSDPKVLENVRISQENFKKDPIKVAHKSEMLVRSWTPERKAEMSKLSSANGKENAEELSDNLSKRWNDEDERKKLIGAQRAGWTEEARNRNSISVSKSWTPERKEAQGLITAERNKDRIWTEEEKKNHSLIAKNSWNDPIKRKVMIEKRAATRALNKNLKILASAKASVKACIKAIGNSGNQ